MPLSDGHTARSSWRIQEMPSVVPTGEGQWMTGQFDDAAAKRSG